MRICLNSITGIGQLYCVYPNLMEIIKVLESKIGAQYIFYNSKVIKIENNRNSVIVHTENERKYKSLIAILSIPWQNIETQIEFIPSIPTNLKSECKFNKKSIVTNFTAKYLNSFWKLFGFSGSIMSYNPYMICYETKPTQISGILYHPNHDGGEDNKNDADDDDYENIEYFEDIIKMNILEKLKSDFGNYMGIPIEYKQHTWEQSLIVNYPPPTMPWNRIIWSSTNSGTIYRGYLNGAVQSGMRAAVLTLLFIRPQTIHWQDINDVQYAMVVKPEINYFTGLTSSLNIYNTLIYFFTLPIISYITYFMYKFINLKYMKIIR